MSLWAYLWMLIVYQFWTPDRITMVEAFLTLAYMPVLIGIAYLLDARPWQTDADIEDHSEPQLYQVSSGDCALFIARFLKRFSACRYGYAVNITALRVSQIVVGARGTDGDGQQYTITREEIHEYKKHNHLDTQDAHEVAKLVAQVWNLCSGTVVNAIDGTRKLNLCQPVPAN